MKYIALLDYDHLDNNLFMKAFANAVSLQKNARGIIIHGDSPYTDRLIQTGMMREDARIRSTKELNRRIVTLLADYGISAIGLDPFHKNTIMWDPSADQLRVNESFFNGLPEQTFLVLSNLVGQENGEKPYALPITKLGDELIGQLGQDELFVFTANKSDEIFHDPATHEALNWEELGDDYKNSFLPKEIQEFPCSFRITSAKSFAYIHDFNESIKILYKGAIRKSDA